MVLFPIRGDGTHVRVSLCTSSGFVVQVIVVFWVGDAHEIYTDHR